MLWLQCPTFPPCFLVEFNILLSVNFEKMRKNTDNSTDYLFIIAPGTGNKRAFCHQSWCVRSRNYEQDWVSLTGSVSTVVYTTALWKVRVMVIPQIFSGDKASILSSQLTKFRLLPTENGLIFFSPRRFARYKHGMSPLSCRKKKKKMEVGP